MFCLLPGLPMPFECLGFACFGQTGKVKTDITFSHRREVGWVPAERSKIMYTYILYTINIYLYTITILNYDGKFW